MPVQPQRQPDTHLHPPLRPWSRVWRYLAASAAGLAAWMATTAIWLSVPLTEAQENIVGAALFLDFVLGAAALALLPLRRRYPLAVVCLTTAMSVFSAASMGPLTLAIVSMATWRRWAWVMVAGVMSLAAGIASEAVYRPSVAPSDESVLGIASTVLLGLVFFAATVATGYYIAARRELVATLQERLQIAEREQAMATKAARDAERTQIAREMHDVLAHRISLVALHAGALAYREDLSRAQTAETAQTIQANAQLALTELRQVLGVLRADAKSGNIEQPQPTLAELPALLADAREAGSVVTLDTSELQSDPGRQLPKLPETLSRTSFRIVQEALTNARKHAPGEPVTVRLSGAPGARLELEVRNPVGAKAVAGLPSAGVGLAGLAERTQLAGGALQSGEQPDGYFVVQASLPWTD